MTTVAFGPLSMRAGGGRDGDYIVESGFFSDWYSVSQSKTEIRERAVADGAFGIDRDWRSGLGLQMLGRFRGDAWPTMLADLSRVAALGTTVDVTVSDAVGVSTRRVQVRKFVPKPMPGAKLCYFAMDLFAVDPKRYGPEQIASTGLPTSGTGQPWPQPWPADWGTGGDPGRVTLVNPGTADTSPLLAVSGGLDGGVQLVEITTGAYLQLDRVIPLGSTAFFNTRTSRVYLDIPDNDISGFTSRRGWEGFQIPAGGTRIIQFNGQGAVSGTPTLIARFSPAF
ncbi:hypothetical protein [uncultured Microbacterium sp.]|uniref:hypothetical protein n=1 Tax=uncultured Microbacterium sp. TaxID=191216 RepID=UPI0025E2207D|nr:hypothetical protein [uncultured Microbacterium sp.]